MPNVTAPHRVAANAAVKPILVTRMIFSPVVMPVLAGPTAGGKENASGNSYLDEGRLFSGERIAQNTFQLIRPLDAAPVDPMTCREGHKVERRQLGARRVRQAEMGAEFFQGLISAVSDDDESYRQPELTGGPQTLNGVHAGAIPDQPDHFLSRFAKRDADCGRYAEPETAAAAGIKSIASIDRQVSLHGTPAARRLLDDDALRRA